MAADRQMLTRRLSAAQFASWELHVYLDTHPTDKEAMEMCRNYDKKAGELKKEYERLYGPLSHETGGGCEWLKNPWPWDYVSEEEC